MLNVEEVLFVALLISMNDHLVFHSQPPHTSFWNSLVLLILLPKFRKDSLSALHATKMVINYCLFVIETNGRVLERSGLRRRRTDTG